MQQVRPNPIPGADDVVAPLALAPPTPAHREVHDDEDQDRGARYHAEVDHPLD